MKQKVIEIEIRFDGFYFWGDGWTTDTKRKWDNYWSNLDAIFFHYTKKKGVSDTDYLVGIDCGGMLHPMDGIHLLIRPIGTIPNYKSMEELKKNEGKVRELIKIMEDCATACGGTAILHRLKLHEFDY